MNTKQVQGIIISGLVTAGLVGAGVALLAKKRKPVTWLEKVRNASSGNIPLKHKKMILSSLAASLVGLASALLTTPHSGREIINRISGSLHEPEAVTKTSSKKVLSESSKKEITPKKVNRKKVIVADAHSPVVKPTTTRRKTKKVVNLDDSD